MKFTAATAAAMGRQGGRSTFARYGTEHMRAIGKKGFATTTARHFGGDRRKHIDDLVRRGLAALDPFPANGAWQRYNAGPVEVERDERE